MESRESFLKGEVRLIKIYLDIFCKDSEKMFVLNDDKRLKKIIQILFEIIERAKKLMKISDDK